MAKTEVCVNNANINVPAFDLKVHAHIGDYPLIIS